ncbi:MAG TPA: protoporphyrinogen oxidase, partial [Bacteroidetes bacterium]|nr:protoporphyrinogen oxidase [Bacteroidota bacterium]
MSKVLIAYATWAGATKEVAKRISETFKENGFDVDLEEAGKIQSIAEYDGIVLGTSIHATKPVRRFTKFIRKFQNELTEKRIALF